MTKFFGGLIVPEVDRTYKFLIDLILDTLKKTYCNDIKNESSIDNRIGNLIDELNEI